MRVVRAFVYGAMALMLAAGWGFLYWQSGTIDLAAGNAARAALADLRAIDARWDDQVIAMGLATRSGPPPQPVAHQAALASLEAQALKLAHPELGRALGAVRTAFDEKAALVRRTLLANAAGEPVVDAAWRVPTRARLDQLGRVMERAFEDALAQTERYRTWLLYYSAFLLALLGVAAIQLRRANRGLEQRVTQRTEELSSTLGKLKESETMLVQSEKMSALGQMVAGVAHEVNTPLAYVKASLEAAQSRAGDAGRLARETRALLELVENESSDEATLAERLAAVRNLLADKRLESLDSQLKDGLHGITQIAELVVSLKDFSRLERGSLTAHDVNQGIEATLRIAAAQLGRRQVKKALGELPRITCSPSQINQVVLNLLVNAAQATPEPGGSIVLRTSLADPEHVAIEVADNGKGIPKDVLPKIFDPFFTTKEAGKGTGLGLSICYRIVAAHGGRIEVDSRAGAGTRFTVVLPIVAQQALAA
jgi:two-component system, NtrC family, sensor kinase